MTGTERLRTLAGAWEEWGLGGVLADVADEIERELRDERDRWESDLYEAQVEWNRVTGVCLEMERHCLYNEDTVVRDVERWARELRHAMKSDASDECGAQNPSCHDPAETADVSSEVAKVTRDPAADVSVSAYDLLPEEDRDAVAWVRDHGGLDYVRAEWRSRVPYDCYERRRQSLLGHIAECEAALRRRNQRIEELGHRVSDITAENAELRKRAMPDGMEWPRFEDSKPVRVGDDVVDEAEEFVYRVSEIAFSDGYGTCLRYEDQRDGNSYNFIDGLEPGERVNRPAPKVLDADGAEIREKCDVWWICEGDERGVHAERLRVETIGPNGLVECSPYNGGTWVYLEPSELYVNEPVIAADGRPLREGETVWYRGHADTLEVRGISTTGSGAHYVKAYNGYEGEVSAPAEDFTHERPAADSWERLEEDACKGVCDYFHAYKCDECEHVEGGCCKNMARDLVRRAKAMVERERGE